MLLAFKHLGAGKISCSAEMSMIFFVIISGPVVLLAFPSVSWVGEGWVDCAL